LHRYTFATLIAGALLFGGSPAHASHSTFQVTADAVNGVTSGSYHVTVDHVSSTTWNVRIRGEAADRGLSGGPAKSSVDSVNIGFSGADWSTLSVLTPATSGGVTSGGSFLASTWITSSRDQDAGFTSPSPMNDLDPFGDNEFQANITLASSADVRFFYVALAGGVQQWTGLTTVPTDTAVTDAGDLAPEPGALALALPGLLPLGLLLKRRRSHRPTPDGEYRG
jgi:hypothetical protein